MCDMAYPVVIDCGSITTRAGFGCDDNPKTTFQTLIADDQIGNDVYNRIQDVDFRRPIQKSMVTNWGDMEKIYKHIYSQLGADSENFAVLLTEPHHNSKQSREKTFEMLFEKFNVPSMQCISQTILAMYANGRTTGIVMDSGDGPTHIVPIFDGYADSYGVIRLPFGGFELTNHLMSMVNERGEQFFNRVDKEFFREMKEKQCYIPVDLNEEMKNPQSASYKLPDGRNVELGNEMFCCPETLFNPALLDVDADSLHKALYTSIQKCDCSIRKDMYNNIVLSGGNTMFRGFVDRITKEIVALTPPQMNIKIIASDTRYYSAWLGGSVLVSLGSFPDFCITKSQYEDAGSSIIHTNRFSR